MAKFRLDMKAVGFGAASGIAMPFGARFLGPGLGPAATNIALGAYAGNETLQTLGGMQLAGLVGGAIPGGVAAGPGGWL